MDYAIYWNGETVGKATVTRQGLYYSLLCRCKPREELCRLEARCGERRLDLGILVPMEQGFGMRTRFPVSKLGEGEPEFRLLVQGQEPRKKTFVPIAPEEPFAYLSRLKDAFLVLQNGKKGIEL